MDNTFDYISIDMDYMNHRKSTPDWRIDREKSLHFIDVTYVVGGSATYIINSHSYQVGAGDLICIPRGSDRQAYGDEKDPVESYCLNFLAHDTRNGQEVVLPFGLVTHIGIHSNVIRLCEDLYASWLLHEEGYRLLSNGYTLVILGLLRSLIADDCQRATADPRVRKAVRYIISHPDEELTAAKLAEMAGLHPVYFSSLFRKNLGYSVGGYIQYIRVNRAEILLAEGTCSVSEVASLCGFCDVYYFSRVFKKIKGFPPSTVKKQRFTTN